MRVSGPRWGFIARVLVLVLCTMCARSALPTAPLGSPDRTAAEIQAMWTTMVGLFNVGDVEGLRPYINRFDALRIRAQTLLAPEAVREVDAAFAALRQATGLGGLRVRSYIEAWCDHMRSDLRPTHMAPSDLSDDDLYVKAAQGEVHRLTNGRGLSGDTCTGLFLLRGKRYGEAIPHLYAASDARGGYLPEFLAFVTNELILPTYDAVATAGQDDSIDRVEEARIRTSVLNATRRIFHTTPAAASAVESSVKKDEEGKGRVVGLHFLYQWDDGDEARRAKVVEGLAAQHGGDRVEPFTTLFGTTLAQRRIHEHQHPPTSVCRDPSTKFIVLTLETLNGHGIGSLVHIISESLALGLELNRIVVFRAADRIQYAVDGPGRGHLLPGHAEVTSDGSAGTTNDIFRFCGDTTTLDCFFEPLSSCTNEDAFGFGQRSSSPKAFNLQSTLPEMRATTDRVVWSAALNYTIPPSILADIAQPPAGISWAHDRAPWLWARAQLTRYIMRPNQRTQDELGRRRSLFFNGHPSVLPRGTISTHVRHGDKGLEMKLVPFDDFMLAVNVLVDELGEEYQQSRAVFVSTEDPLVVAKADTYGQRLGDAPWHVSYTRNERKNLPIFELISTFGAVNEMLNGLLNLQIATECDAWVCTPASNWCGLIDELRSTALRKAHLPYVDIGYRCFQGCAD